MKQYPGYEQVEAFTGEYEVLEPGGYICKILAIKAEDKDYGQLLRIAYDIAEGEHKDYYKRRFESAKQTNAEAKWQGMYYQTVKPDDLRYFKGFITSVEKSNPGYKWNWDEKSLAGKLFGGVFGQEEYLASDGKVKTSTKCMFIRSIDKIRAGIEAPPIKKLTNVPATNSSVSNADDGDLPF
jgi:hypothetical protein